MTSAFAISNVCALSSATAASYWVRSRRRGLWHYELAGEEPTGDWAGCARGMLQADADGAQWSEMFDSAQQSYRGARFVAGRLDSCIFIGPDHRLPPRDWLIELFARECVDGRERMRVLAGTPGNGQQDAGRIVCSCFSVGRNTVRHAIQEFGLQSPEEYDGTVRDLVTFLAYLSEPAQLERKDIGIWVLLFLAFFAMVAYLLKSEYWRDVH